MTSTTTISRAGDTLRQAIADLTRVAEWVDRMEVDGIEVRTADVADGMVYVSPGTAETYEAITSRLVEVVDLSDPAAIKPPGASGGQWTIGKSGRVKVVVFAPRGVCERVEVGTEVVEVPDPDAPKIRQERPVYEWRCAEAAS